ncbi:MAG: two-component regulator propeller domain-containing protein [Rudaea sp.]|uniref:ligand-binding sensor domain-containing protein n=1 Tax=Rudaea sp. TaxID=2136325 RepID=UPI0039E4B314
MPRLFACVAMLSGLLAAAPAPAAGALELRSPAVLRHYDDKDGLPQLSVNTMLRTRDGFLWIGTFGGLVRFDGREFRTFRATEADASDGPISRRIVSLYEDDRGRLWIATEDAGVTVYENGRFRHLSVCGGNCQAFRTFSTDGRDMWLLAQDALCRIDPETLQETYCDKEFSSFGIEAHYAGRVFIGGPTGLASVSAAGAQRVRLPDGYDSYRYESVRNIGSDGAALWVIVRDGGLYRYVAEGDRWTFIRGGLPPEAHLMYDGAGGMYLSDSTAGVRRLAFDGRESPIEGMERLTAVSALADGEGGVWFGTSSKGLWRLRPSRVSLLRSTTAPELPGRVVAADGEGGVWLVMGCMDLWHLRADGSQTVTSTAAVRGGCIHSLLRDDAGVLWIGIQGGTLARLANDRLERVAAWPIQTYVGIWKAQDGRLWLANSSYVGRLRLTADGRFDGIEKIPELAGMDVKSIVDARAGGVWVVGDRGAFRVVGDAVVERWTPAQGIRGRFFRALYEDADGTIWIGTYGNGLVRIEHGAVSQYTEADGLFDDTVSCILPNADGRLWLAGNRGIGLLDRRIDAGGPAVLTLTSSDGLEPAEFNGGAAPPCADDGAGHLWFSMMIGFARVEPGKLQNWAANHVPVAYVDHAAVSQGRLDLFRPASLGVNASNLEIRYGAIDLLNPDKVRYRYRMTGIEGGEADWIDAGGNRSLLLPVVPWGSLTFELQARELGGAWSPSATLRLERPRPWYKYQWIVLAASLASLLALLWATRERRVAHVDDALLARLRRPAANADSGRGGVR